MYEHHRVLGIIPARGGSKGLPGKNIKELAGKPLIAYTIAQAQASRYIDRILVSTDSPRIAEVARRHNAEAPFMRPPDLANDKTGMLAVLLHAIEWLEHHAQSRYDIIVLLQVTSPLRETEDIDNCIALLVEKNAENVFAVTPSHTNPYFTMVEIDENGKVRPVKSSNAQTRQSAPSVFEINGAVYVWWTDVLQQQQQTLLDKSHIYIMPKERSIDIDDSLDFNIASMILHEKRSAGNSYFPS